MNYGTCKKIFLSLVDEYDPTQKVFTTDEDIKNKLPYLFNTAYQILANTKMESKTKELDFEYTGEKGYSEVKLPKCRKIKNIYCLDQNNIPTEGDFFYISDRKIMISTLYDIKYIVEYIPHVTEIDEDTEDDFELELPNNVASLLPYAVASDLLKTDTAANYAAFEQKYNSLLQNLDLTSRGINVNITGGVF